jgi:hypothetical protein
MWVSTDDAEIGSIISKEYPTVGVHYRAKYTAADNASSIIAVQEFLTFHPGKHKIADLIRTSRELYPQSVLECTLKSIGLIDCV